MAIREAQRSALVVAPTLDLMNQWYDVLRTAFDAPVGLLGGGYVDPRDLTVATYDSAYLHMERLGDRWGLVIFDEVHHLPGPHLPPGGRMLRGALSPRAHRDAGARRRP
jgi:superfamily II DNA or RNA helicase